MTLEPTIVLYFNVCAQILDKFCVFPMNKPLPHPWLSFVGFLCDTSFEMTNGI